MYEYICINRLLCSPYTTKLRLKKYYMKVFNKNSNLINNSNYKRA